MKSLWLFLCCALLILTGCRTTERQDRNDLRTMRLEIQRVVGIPSCTDSASCALVGVGSKPCGGPWEYVIYSTASTDTALLMDRVREYNAFEDRLNRKWKWISDCSLPHMPRVGCRDGVCVDLDRP